jgi:hypothetical protein
MRTKGSHIYELQAIIMRLNLYILSLLISTFGCHNKLADKTSNVDTSKIEENIQTTSFTYNEYKSDNISIDIKNENYNFKVILKIGELSKEYDLKMLNIPIKNPPELYWISDDYACMVTWYSQAQSRHIFIPIKKNYEFIYLDKDIEEMDSTNNNIVYIDSVTENTNKVVFKVENLLTRRNKSVTFHIDRYNGNYPFYESIMLTKNKLKIKTAYENKIIDINEINNGL